MLACAVLLLGFGPEALLRSFAWSERVLWPQETVPIGGRVLASETWGLPLRPGLRLTRLACGSDEMVSFTPS